MHSLFFVHKCSIQNESNLHVSAFRVYSFLLHLLAFFSFTVFWWPFAFASLGVGHPNSTSSSIAAAVPVSHRVLLALCLLHARNACRTHPGVVWRF